MTATPDLDVHQELADSGPIELVPPDSLTAEHTALDVPHPRGRGIHDAGHAPPRHRRGHRKVLRSLPRRPGRRAIRSVDSVLRWTYGGGAEAAAEGDRVLICTSRSR